MNATDTLKLDAKVKEMQTDIKVNRRSQKVLADELAAILGFKVSVSALGQVLRHNGIETKGSKMERQITALQEQVRVFRTLLAEVLPQAPKAPEHLVGRIKSALAEAERVTIAS
jgi:hypothetical protein